MRKDIILMLHINYAIGHIIIGPRNVAVVAGDAMSMECRTDVESRVLVWILIRADGEPFEVYLNGVQSPYFPEFTHFGSQVNASGSGIIYTNSTRMSDAGLYMCVTRHGSAGKTVKVTAHLTVFESHPVCETNLTVHGKKSLVVGDFIWFRCSVSFRGFWTPTMEWIQHRKNGDTCMGNILTGGVELVRLPNTSVTSTLIIKVDSSMKGVFFSCRTYFAEYEGKPFLGRANNTPSFNYTWNSEAAELPNYVVPETGTIAIDASLSSAWQYSGILLVVGLSVFWVLVILAVTVFCKRKRARDGRQSMQLSRTTQEPHSSTELTSGTAAEVDTERLKMTATSADYCSLTGVGISLESKVYCQLRLEDPQDNEYVNIASNEHSRPNENAMYCNVAQ